jgi:hypothetical protein
MQKSTLENLLAGVAGLSQMRIGHISAHGEALGDFDKRVKYPAFAK